MMFQVRLGGLNWFEIELNKFFDWLWKIRRFVYLMKLFYIIF